MMAGRSSRSFAKAPPASSADVARRMRATRQCGTNIEVVLCSELAKLGIFSEKNALVLKPLRTRADLVFRHERVAVFVDGCFWHSCPIHGTFPKRNRIWWKEKLAANQERDGRASRLLRRAGWSVLRFWEHQIKDTPRDIALKIVRRVQRRSTIPPRFHRK